MRTPHRPASRRICILLIVVVLHVLLLSIVLEANRFQKRAQPERYATITFLPPPAQPALPSPSTQSASRRRNSKSAERTTDNLPSAAPSNAITLPRTDWQAEAAAAVSAGTEREEAEKRRRNLAGPSDSQLDWSRNNAPPPHDHHETGDTEHAEGGQTITWLSDKCYVTTAAATPIGLPETKKICKDPPKPDDELFKDLARKLDDAGAKILPH